MKEKIKFLVVVAVLLTSTIVGVSMVAGNAAANTATPTDTSTAANTPTATETATDGDNDSYLVEMPYNKTLNVDSATRALVVNAENTNGSAAITVTGIDDGGNETVEAVDISLNADGEDATDSYEFSDVNATQYDKYRVQVIGNGAEHLQVQELALVGGGGLIGNDSSTAFGLVVFGAVIGAAVLYQRKGGS